MHFHCEEHKNSFTETNVNQDRNTGKIKEKNIFFKGKKKIFTFEHAFVAGDSSGALSAGLTSGRFSFILSLLTESA